MASETDALIRRGDPDLEADGVVPQRQTSTFANPTFLWRAGSAFITVGAVTGAFGSHAMQKHSEAKDVQSWNIASNYAIYNGLALLAISLHPRFGIHKFAGPAVITGATMFCGSIWMRVLNREKFGFLGPAAPLGGTLFMVGFASLAF